MKYRSVKMMRGVMIADENGKFLSTVEVVSLLNDLQQRLAEAESKIPKWIPVEERLPKPGADCLKRSLSLTIGVSGND